MEGRESVRDNERCGKSQEVNTPELIGQRVRVCEFISFRHNVLIIFWYYATLVPYDFCLFPKLRGCLYETIEEMKEALTKVIDTLAQDDFHDLRIYRKLGVQVNILV